MSAAPTPSTGKGVDPAFSRRNLTARDVQQLALTVVPWDVVTKETGVMVLPKTEAERIPYFDLNGAPLTYDNGTAGLRFRRHVPEGTKPKYIGPRGVKGSIAYLPRLDNVDWLEIANDPTTPIVIVEGEYKAIALCKLGIPAVGVGGIYSFKNASGKGLAAPLDRFVMKDSSGKGRRVAICYDADTVSTQAEPLKPSVRQGMEALGNTLKHIGAEPVVWYLARTKVYVPGTKLGVDDFIEADGDIEDLFATETVFEYDAQLAEMMDTYAIYTGGKSHILNLKTGATHNPTDFVAVITADKITETHDGKVIKVATRFINGKDRPVFDRYIFDPNLAGGFDREAKTYNSWDGWDTIGVRDAKWEAVYERFMKQMCGDH